MPRLGKDADAAPAPPLGGRLGELWRRVRQEFVLELPLLRERWGIILAGAAFQYVHGIFTQLAHRLAQPQAQPLHDLGFALLPELGRQREWISESLFALLFALLVAWSFSPFAFRRKRFYTVLLWSRMLTTVSACQAMRIVSFSVTQLPASNYHCRLGEATAVRAWPAHWWGHLVVDVGRQVGHGCGDLIFSSHTIFALCGCLAYNEFGASRAVKGLVWGAVAALSALIIASRKHYTVDVALAWFVVPLTFLALRNRWTTRRPLLLPPEGSDRLDEEVEVLLPVSQPHASPAAAAAAARAGEGPVQLVTAKAAALAGSATQRQSEASPYQGVAFSAPGPAAAPPSGAAQAPQGAPPPSTPASAMPSPSRRLQGAFGGVSSSAASPSPAHKRGSARASPEESPGASETGDEEALLHPRGPAARGSGSPVLPSPAGALLQVARAVGTLFGGAGRPS